MVLPASLILTINRQKIFVVVPGVNTGMSGLASVNLTMALTHQALDLSHQDPDQDSQFRLQESFVHPDNTGMILETIV